MEPLNVVSLFSGCGGLDLGFQNPSFNITFASDNDEAAVRAYRYNLGHDAELLDVTDATFDDRLRKLVRCDVLLGGFPCQGFSKAGPKLQGDVRNQLYKAMITALGVLRPRVFVAENVDGLAQNFQGSFLRQIVADCAEVGYKVEWKVVDAAWFGIPQHRRRVVIIGVLDDASQDQHIPWPIATHRWLNRNGEKVIHYDYPSWASNLLSPRSIADAIDSLRPGMPDHEMETVVNKKNLTIIRAIGPGQKLCNARHDQNSVRTWDIPEAFGPTTARERTILETVVRNRRHRKYGSIPNGNPLSLDTLRELVGSDLMAFELDALVARKFLKRLGEKWEVSGAMFASGIYKRPLADQPSPTVLTNFHNPRFFVHPVENRAFTVREVARLQTFPDSFCFEEAGIDRVDAYRLIGNAVPPLLAEQIASTVLAICEAEVRDIAA
ncbi:DNA cytosine methyltransferase [Cryobacterium sp. TMT2-18-3]|uniref:DNA cytosine methyltransferase n=1 Tax=unclassified Cryobacterium TaxID=2649013 RepID=UPI00106C2CED|nr:MULTISPECIES: DNA cytosine methyltransferase [unclassified Cryobacterium]TFC26535.1 DNA cytosine methyltransferase [Cryobacterium sp. TMT2-18-2]TFC68090.1 DNA cytosine methyltransferase [Cryobacterium sp. TMT2-18-3]